MDIPGSLPTNSVRGIQQRDTSEVETDCKATLGRKNLVKLSSLSKLVQDLQDEMSFANSEKVESEDNMDEMLEDRSKQVRESLVKRVRDVYQSDQAGGNNHPQMDRLMARVRQGQYQHPDQLLEDLGQLCSDKGELFSLLAAMGDNLEEGSSSAKLVADALADAAVQWESEITAGANTLAKAGAFAARTGIERDRFQRSYQESVVAYECVIKTLAELVHKFGLEQFQAGAEFLQEAALSDLASMSSSVEYERLEHTLLELQGVKVFNTWQESIEKSLERAAGKDPLLARIERDWLVHGFVRSLDRPHEFDLNMKQKFSYADNIENQVLLLQDLKNAVAETPEHYFAEGGKERAITPWQNEIDRLIYQEAGS